MLPVIISAAAAIIVAALTVFLTKSKERETAWRDKKLEYYEEFILAANNIVGSASDQDKIGFAKAVNKLNLVASNGVLSALHEFCDEIAESNTDSSKDKHDRLWSILVWEIRDDLDDSPTKNRSDFIAKLWASGAGSNS